ncbi:hypothetical protein KEM56_002287 [Ascosphaera pollenicola]|nr:hypothetical protein KEM56_002287 [Ascosphaera pollenicola]
MLNSCFSIARASRLYRAFNAKVHYTQCQCRFASLNSSIGRGIRQSRSAHDRQSRGYDQAPRWGERDSRSRRDGDAEAGDNELDDRRFSIDRRRGNGGLDRDNGDRASFSKRGGRDEDTGYYKYQHADRSRPRSQRGGKDLQRARASNQEPLQATIERLQSELDRLEKQMKMQSIPEEEKKPSHHYRPSSAKRSRDNFIEDLEVYYPLRDVKKVCPRHIVYTKAGTEFIYGSSAVLAALRCRRRKFYKLYIYQPDGPFNNSDGIERRASVLKAIQKEGLNSGAEVIDVSGNWLPYLGRLSDKRPHNGVVLEATPLPQPPILALRSHRDPSDTHFKIQLAPQQSDEAEINGTNETISRFFHTHDTDVFGSSTGKMERYPMVVVLDNIKDPGNLGAIIRSAYYFGVDAVILSRSCPAITPVVLKTSAGAAENLPIFRVTNPQSFIQSSRENGWQFYAADAPDPESASHGQAADAEQRKNALQPSSVSQKLYNAPCALVMGSEDRGLDNKILNVVNDRVSIISALTRSAAEDNASVDSLNVSVAAALLCQSFLGDSAIVQRAPTFGPALTVPQMVNERMQDDRAQTDEEKE